MIPPKGFKAEMYPLRHEMFYALGMSAVTVGKNTCILTLVKNYKGADAANTVDTNPHHASFVVETGAICVPMSIIDKLRLKLQFTWTKNANTISATLKGWWQPIFFSFPEKLDAADDKTTTTVAALLGLLKDATQEDVTPLFNNIKFDTTGASDRTHPVSTINLTETFGILNMDTDLTMEGITHDDKAMQRALAYYTNKGALRACLGKRRYFTLDRNHNYKSYFIDKFVPRPVRRIMPYSFFGIMIHIPLTTEDDQVYHSSALTADVAYVGVNAKIRYHEWNADHNQELSGGGA